MEIVTSFRLTAVVWLLSFLLILAMIAKFNFFVFGHCTMFLACYFVSMHALTCWHAADDSHWTFKFCLNGKEVKLLSADIFLFPVLLNANLLKGRK